MLIYNTRFRVEMRKNSCRSILSALQAVVTFFSSNIAVVRVSLSHGCIIDFMQLLPWCHCIAISCANKNQAIPSGNSGCYLCICDIRYMYIAVYLFIRAICVQEIDSSILYAFCNFEAKWRCSNSKRKHPWSTYHPREIWLHAYGFWQVIIRVLACYYVVAM